LYNIVLYAPLDEVQLSDCGCHGHVSIWNAEFETVRTTKWIEEFFAVTIQTRLVGAVDGELFARRSRVTQVCFFRIICDEPLQVSKRDAFAFFQHIS
jgi:hypothetical protein